MTDLDAVATFRLYADAIGLALLPLGFGLAGWFAWKARQRDRREAIPLKPEPIFPGAKRQCQRHRKGRLFILFEVADPGGEP